MMNILIPLKRFLSISSVEPRSLDISSLLTRAVLLIKDRRLLASERDSRVKALALCVIEMQNINDAKTKLVVLETESGDNIRAIIVLGTQILYDPAEKFRRTQIYDQNSSIIYRAGKTDIKAEYFTYVSYTHKAIMSRIEKA
jgi:hypothetical protein